MKILAFAFLCSIASSHAGLDSYRQFVVQDSRDADSGAVRITYLGTNGYEIRNGRHSLLIDPYFTRAALLPIALDLPLESDPDRVDEGLAHVRPHPDAILVTHGHFDHMLDVPPILKTTGARLIASPTAVNLAQAKGISPARCQAVLPGKTIEIGPWSVRVLGAEHDRLFGTILPYPGTLSAPPRSVNKPTDWVLGEPLAFLIETGGKRIYIDSGGRSALLPPLNAGPVDLAIVGVALGDSRERLAATLQRLRPRLFLPSHQDHFFRPLDRGFVFGPMSGFPGILREMKAGRLRGRLILLDYFRPWTLP